MKTKIALYIFSLILPVQHLDASEWQKTVWKAPVLEPRLVHAMAGSRSGTLLFGGRLLAGGRSDETILIDGEGPRVLNVERPSAREGHSLTTGAAGKVFLFGGNTEQGPDDALWVYNGEEWQEISYQGPGPAPRWAHGSTYYDDALWVFGGKGESKGDFYQDLWFWDGSSWQMAAADEKPQPRYGAQLGTHDGKIILYGGRNHSGDWFTDTWIWTRAGWRKASHPENLPQPRSSVGFVMMTTPSDLFLVGGILKGDVFNEMWKWNGKVWELIEERVPFALDFPAGCYSPEASALVVSGASEGSLELWKYELE